MRERRLAGLTLWITRPQAEQFGSVLRFGAMGAQVHGVPLVERVDLPVAAAQLRALPEGCTVVLASSYAAARWLHCLGLHPPLAGCPIAIVGERAAGPVDGLEPGVVLRASTAKELLERLEGDGPFVLAGSSRRRPELPEGLRARGKQVLELDLYRIGTPDELRVRAWQLWTRDRPDAVAFYSPSAVDNFLSLGLPGGRSVAALAIGPTTAGRLRSRGIEAAAIAEPPGEEALAAATARWWAGRR